ncbi:MAG TPA: thermonuclease family protein [Tepidisphaeraceae bacterium]|nr:thermonuclease family protein [Tepidisphaeraceae bacterium]
MRRPSPIPTLLRRRLRYRRILLALLALLGVSIYVGRPSGDDWAIYDRQEFIVTQVIDGDTIDVAAHPGAKPTRVRLLGVDAPELRGDDGSPEHWADAAKRYAIARSNKRAIVLRLELTRTRDKYKRLLAYVHLSDGETLNFALVRDGQAYAHRGFNHTMRSQYEQAENAARKKGTGLWKDVKASDMPAWRQRWLDERTSSSRAAAAN